MNVAVVVEDFATLIDFAGPMEVFACAGNESGHAFWVYTVSETRLPVRASGVLVVQPEFELASSPPPDIVLVGALGFGPNPQVVRYVREAHERGSIIVSVCTGAFVLGRAGLLDGRTVTTHHASLDQLAKQFPKAKVVRDTRFVQASERVFCAAGMSSGIDLALHLVERFFGRKEATTIAEYMEYQGTAWKLPKARR
jgi:transcriptional regulator GlxA family with amidase domain